MHRIIGLKVIDAARTDTCITLFFRNGARADWRMMKTDECFHEENSHNKLIGREITKVSEETYTTGFEFWKEIKVYANNGSYLNLAVCHPTREGVEQLVAFSFTPPDGEAAS